MVDRAHKPSNIPVSPQDSSPQAMISNENGRVTATLPSGEYVEVLLHGATVISWRNANGRENLYVSSKARLDGSKAVRGGIPIVFPVFGPPPPKPHAASELPQHGLARISHWEYLGKTSSESSTTPTSGGDSSVKLDFGLSSEMVESDLTDQWPKKFGLTYSVTLSTQGLETSLQVSNGGKSTWAFQVLLHTYLKIDNISDVVIQGLETTPFTDKVALAGMQKAIQNELKPNGDPSDLPRTKPSMDVITFNSEIDRVYHNAHDGPIRVLDGESPRFEIVRDILADVVVWNPWEKKAAGMSDMGEGEWRGFVCVEAGSVSEWAKVDSGETWEGGQRIMAL